MTVQQSINQLTQLGWRIKPRAKGMYEVQVPYGLKTTKYKTLCTITGKQLTTFTKDT